MSVSFHIICKKKKCFFFYFRLDHGKLCVENIK